MPKTFSARKRIITAVSLLMLFAITQDSFGYANWEEYTTIKNPNEPSKYRWSEPTDVVPTSAWGTGQGFFEYEIPVNVPEGAVVKRIRVKAEVCSEFYLCKDDWPSDISLLINDVLVDTWTAPGDPCIGGKDNGEHGYLKEWTIEKNPAAFSTITAGQNMRLRFEVLPTSQNKRGLMIWNSFGGLYSTNIVVTLWYSKEPNIVIIKHVTPDQVQEGDTMVITTEVRNIGINDALSIRMKDAIPNNFMLTSGTLEQTYDRMGVNYVGTNQYTVNAPTEVGYTYKSRFSPTVVEYYDYDGNLYTKESRPVEFTVKPKKPEMVMDKYVSKAIINGNDEVTVTIEVTNKGRRDAINVELTDFIPGGFTLTEGSNANIKLGSLNTGETRIHQYRMKALTPGLFLSSAYASYEDYRGVKYMDTSNNMIVIVNSSTRNEAQAKKTTEAAPPSQNTSSTLSLNFGSVGVLIAAGIAILIISLASLFYLKKKKAREDRMGFDEVGITGERRVTEEESRSLSIGGGDE